MKCKCKLCLKLRAYQTTYQKQWRKSHPEYWKSETIKKAKAEWWKKKKLLKNKQSSTVNEGK
jgi:hypothetical protein